MDYDFKEVEKAIRKKLRRFKDVTDYEDAIQEALISAWNDIENGEITELNHIVNRAFMVGRSHLFDNRVPTGGTKRGKSGYHTARGDITREKIAIYVEEYMAIHDRMPPLTKIADNVGLSTSSVGAQVRRMKLGLTGQNAYIPVEDKQGSIDYKAYTYTSLDYTHTNPDSFSKTIETSLMVDSFEEEWVSKNNYENLISILDEDEKRIITYHLEGYTFREIGFMMGLERLHSQTMVRAHNRIMKKLKEAYNPPLCNKGLHLMTAENKNDASRCKQCNAKSPRKYPEGKRAKADWVDPRKLATHCHRNHEITGVRSNGKRYCKECNSSRMKGKNDGGS